MVNNPDPVKVVRDLLDAIAASPCADSILDTEAAGAAFALIAESEGRRHADR